MNQKPQNNEIDPMNFFAITRDSSNGEAVSHPIVWTNSKDVDFFQDFGALEDLYAHEQHDEEMAEEAFSQNDSMFEDPVDLGTGPINQEHQEHFN